MALQEGDFVRIRYTGRIGGDVFDTTDEEIAKEEDVYNQMAEYGPVTIRLGSHHILAGLEEELIGKEVGTEERSRSRQRRRSESTTRTR